MSCQFVKQTTTCRESNESRDRLNAGHTAPHSHCRVVTEAVKSRWSKRVVDRGCCCCWSHNSWLRSRKVRSLFESTNMRGSGVLLRVGFVPGCCQVSCPWTFDTILSLEKASHFMQAVWLIEVVREVRDGWLRVWMPRFRAPGPGISDLEHLKAKTGTFTH